MNIIKKTFGTWNIKDILKLILLLTCWVAACFMVAGASEGVNVIVPFFTVLTSFSLMILIVIFEKETKK